MLTRLADAGVPQPLLVSSLIWGAWHLPLVLSGQYAAGDDRALSATVFLVGVVGAGVVAGHLRLTTGSVWPAAVFHASWNAVIQGVFDASTRGGTTWVGESGLLVAAVNLGLAAWLVRGRWPMRRAPGDEPFAEGSGLPALSLLARFRG
jgi:membrane protease YdiL (CAAX protease family)